MRKLHEFVKEHYAQYRHMNEFWQGWRTNSDSVNCPYPADTLKATAWYLGAEAREDYETEGEQ